MNRAMRAIAEWGQSVVAAWNRFWFTPTDPATLGLLRILAGAMLFYTHLVWTLDLPAFFGPHAWISPKLLDELQRGTHLWTHFRLIHSPAVLWTAHLLALAILLMFMLGLFSRVTAVLAYLITVSYLNRISLAEFGLDRINVMLAMYLMIGPSGARYSLDRLWRRRLGAGSVDTLSPGVAADAVPPSIAANVAVRLIQVHMCVIYFFAGSRKLLGGTWWNGTAMWGSVANLEYQSIDLTWLAAWPMVIAVVTNLTVFFELFYPALIWPRLTRPVMLALAVFLHLGIILALGMPTFGLVMLIGNAAFLSPELVRTVLEPGRRRAVAAGRADA